MIHKYGTIHRWASYWHYIRMQQKYLENGRVTALDKEQSLKIKWLEINNHPRLLGHVIRRLYGRR